MDMLLAVCVLLLSAGWVYTIVKNNELHHRVEGYKALHSTQMKQTREWEGRALDAELQVSDLMAEVAPPSHNVKAIDAEQVMSDSEDPLWGLVGETRDLMVRWELKCSPGMAASQPHVRFSAYGTFVGNLPPRDQNRDGIEAAIEEMEKI